MANTIRLKRGTTEPTAGVLVTGEVAINTTNGNAYTLTDAGDVVQIGASSIALEATVRNETGSPLTKGQVVYLNGASGNKALAVLAQANSEMTSAGTYGLVKADIANNNNGTVVIAGFINKLNTQGYTDGDKIYLSPTTAGGWTTTKPSAPNHMVFLGTIVYAHQTQGAIQLRIANGFELEELHNVSISQTLADKDIIAYNSATQLYENRTATALGLAPLANPNFTGNVTAGTNLVSSFSSGDEGGEIQLAKPQTNTTLAGTVSIDVYQNRLRIFENGGTTRGAYIDLTAATAGVGSNLLAGGGGGGSWGSITGTLSSQTDLQNALDAKANLASPALTGNVTITANSASPALSIVQDGAGDIVQFKDVTSDTTYSFIDQSGKVNTIASTTANAGFRIPSGVAPTTPVAGDIWNTGSSLLFSNGTTSFTLASLNATSSVFTGTTFTAGNPATGSAFVNIGTVNHASGTSKTINIGTGGQSGSNTTVNIGAGSLVNSSITIGGTGTSTTQLNGTVTATTPTTADNSTKVATTAYVKSNLASYATTSALTSALTAYTPTASLNNSLIGTTVNTIFTDYYTYATTAQNSVIVINNEGATSHTIYFSSDMDDGMPIGTQIVFVQADAYSATFMPADASGVTLLSRGGRYTMNGQDSVATAIKIYSNTWVLSGDLTTPPV